MVGSTEDSDASFGGADSPPPPPPRVQATPPSPGTPQDAPPPPSTSPFGAASARAAQQQPTQSLPPYIPPGQPPVGSIGAPHPATKKSKAPLVIGVGLLFALLLGGGLVAALLFARSSADETSARTADNAAATEADDVNIDGDPDGGGADPVNDADTPGFFDAPVAEDRTVIDVAAGGVEQFEGSIDGNAFDSFELALEAGDVVLVSVEADSGEQLDTQLRAVDPDGLQAAANDDAPETAGLANTFDSQISFEAEQSGIYVLEVLAFNAQQVGGYVLTVDRSISAGEQQADDVGVFDPDGPTAPVFGEGGIEDTIVLSTLPNEAEVVRTALDDGTAIDVFTFQLEAGETVGITVEAGEGAGIDPFIVLSEADGDVVVVNDDAPIGAAVGGALDSSLAIRVPRAGTYVLEVFAFNGLGGDYTFSLERGEGDGGGVLPFEELEADLESSLFIERGESVTIDGRLEDLSAFDLILEDGDTVTISVVATDSTPFDPFVFLDFDGMNVGFNDDAEVQFSDSRFDSQLILSTANTGVHTIFVARFDGATDGNFTMTVERN